MSPSASPQWSHGPEPVMIERPRWTSSHRVDGAQWLSEAPFVTPATMHFIHLSPSSRSLILRTALGNNFCEEQFFSSSHHSSMSTPWLVCSVNPADYTMSYRPMCGQFFPIVSTLISQCDKHHTIKKLKDWCLVIKQNSQFKLEMEIRKWPCT